MQTIYFNNSSLDELACSARYLYKVIRGARTQKSPELSIGTAFHHLMNNIAPDVDAGLLEVMTLTSCKEYAALATSTRINLCSLARQVQAEIALAPSPYQFRELYFEFLDTPRLDYDGWESFEEHKLLRCGTVDVLDFDPKEECAIITDYKTTRKPLDADFFTDYALKSQRPFYITSLQDAAERCALSDHNIPPEMHTAIRHGRIKFRYVFINYLMQKVFVQPAAYMHEDALAQFSAALKEKQALAVFLHFNQSTVQKEGMFSNHCYFCPFKRVCAEHNPQREAELFAQWPMGFTPYDPRKLK